MGLLGRGLQAANFVELHACEVPRIPLPRTRVNKGKNKGRSQRLRPFEVIDLGAAAQPSQLLRYVLWRGRIRLTPSDRLGLSRHGIHDVHDGFEAELEDREGCSQFLHIGHVVRF